MPILVHTYATKPTAPDFPKSKATARVKHIQGGYYVPTYATLTRHKWDTRGLDNGWAVTLPQRRHGHHFCVVGSLFRNEYLPNFDIGVSKNSPTD